MHQLPFNSPIFSKAFLYFHEPASYKQASHDPLWVKAMESGIEDLQANNTSVKVDLPLERKAVSSKWVYKVKLKDNGSIKRYKARLVIRGNTQRESIDFIERLSPVVKMTTIKVVLTLAAFKQWQVFQMDVNNVFFTWEFV